MHDGSGPRHRTTGCTFMPGLSRPLPGVIHAPILLICRVMKKNCGLSMRTSSIGGILTEQRYCTRQPISTERNAQ